MLARESSLAPTLGLNKILFTHRNHKLNKQVQETQKQYAYLSVTYIQNDNHTDTYDIKMANYCQNVKTTLVVREREGAECMMTIMPSMF